MPAPAPGPEDWERLFAPLIRDVPDFPQPGVVFKDITPLLADPAAFAAVVAALAGHGRDAQDRTVVDKVVGIEARGFIIASPVAYHFGAGFVPIRKQGKLPSETVGEDYELEYGTATLELHIDGITPGERVLIVDDVLATGGTAQAAASLVQRVGGKVCGIATVIELEFLHGRERLAEHEVYTLIRY
jgi:adenine phosphoribosyltransferase